MAIKTVNREVKRFGVKDLNEKYINFSSFNGLCDNKNYLGIDQNTFTDVNNLYMDQDLQLSSRPPIKRINFVNPDEYVIKIYKVNNLSFYHTRKEDTYWLHFKHREDDVEDKWHSIKVTENINIMWLDTRYAIFLQNNLIGFNYNYDTKKIEWYEAKDMIYVPVTNIVHNGVKTSHEQLNVLTDSSSVRYTFDGASMFDVITNKELLGKLLTVNIGEESFEIVWQLNNQKVFTSLIGNVDADLFQVKSDGRVLAAKENAYSGYAIYYSFDGVLFYNIVFPVGVTDANIFFADDCSAVYLIDYVDNMNAKVYVKSLISVTTPGDIAALVWQSYSISPPANYSCDFYRPTTPFQVKTDWSFTFGASDYRYDFTPFGHSPEINKFVAMLPITCTYETNTNQSGSVTHAMLLILVNDELKVYHTGDVIADNSAGQGQYRCPHKIRLLPSSITNPLIAVSYCSNLSSDYTGGQRRTFIVMNDAYIPYHHYEIVGERTQRNYYATDVNQDDTISNFGRWFPEYSFGVQDLLLTSEGGRIGLINVYFNNKKEDKLYSTTLTLGTLSTDWPSLYPDTYTIDTFRDDYSKINASRRTPPIQVTTSETSTVTIGTMTEPYAIYKLDISKNILTDRYFRYGDNNIQLLKRNDNLQIPLYVDEDVIVYVDSVTNNIYRNNYNGIISTDIFTPGDNFYLLPKLVATFISNALAVNNKLYIASKREGKLYIPREDVLSFSNDITALVNFTQTSLGIFLEDEVHELLYNTDNDIYILSRTKLQLGCKKDADILLNYDGKTIFTTTLKGLTALDYQDFVQSTEHVYSYLTEKIMTSYDKYSAEPLKLTQFKNWIFMYRTDVNYLYVFDLRNQSWWKWTNIADIQQIVFDGDNLLILIDGIPYSYDFDFDGENYYDEVGQKIEWTCTSQRLHFNAPNNYKQIRSFSIITSQENESILRCKLQLKCYHNIHNTIDMDTVEYELDQVTTAIYKVNFFKLNAFQFTISSDETEKDRREFVTPDIAIKYRITERIR